MATKKKKIAKKQPQNEKVTTLEVAYDEFPYESFSYPQTQPPRLHTVATLFGLTPSDIHKAKILEIGCAAGGNLLPLALLYPGAHYVGFDLSQEQITQANNNKEKLGLKNITFFQQDVTKLPQDLGEFDYIICHGVFSWVPDFVREGVLNVCRRHLSKNGLALISYNTLPGWSAVKSLREMMLYHTKNFKNPAQQVHEAKMLLNFIHENTPASNESYRQIIDRERKILNSTNDSYLFHEHLESENHQFYFHQFWEMIDNKDLAYVGDSEFASMFVGNLSSAARNTIGKIGDIVRQEQYMDFLTNRRFRHSIITHKENISRINRNLGAQKILDFYIEPRFRPENLEQAPSDNDKFVSTSNKESTFVTREKTASVLFRALAEKRFPVRVNDFIKELEETKGINPVDSKNILLKNGITLALQAFIALHPDSVSFATTVSKKPKAFSLARYYAEILPQNIKTVTNIKRESVGLSTLDKALLAYLDGTHTVDDLSQLVAKKVVNGEIKLHQNGVQITEQAQAAELLKSQIPSALQKLANLALLES